MTTIALTVLAVLALQQPAAPDLPPARELSFCTQHGPVFVRVQGGQGAGVYSILGNGDIGAFVGTVVGRTLEGRWYETDSRGDIRIAFAEDWNAIDLQYRSDSDGRWRGDWAGVPAPADGSRSVNRRGVDYLCGSLTAAGRP